MSSACIREFLSHPIEKEKHSLIEHLLDVGKTSRGLFLKTNFTNTSLAFYSGLLHDVGKMNSFYQEIFHDAKDRKNTEKIALEKYVQEHSRFSAWAAEKLLQKIDLDYATIDKIMVLIYGHHSKIRKSLGTFYKDEKFCASQKSITNALPEFVSQVSEIAEFPKFDWKSCIEEFSHPMEFDVELKSKNTPDDYLEMSCAFSCLLQADRGSFAKWSVPDFDLKIDTGSMIKNSSLGKIRTGFQEQVMKNFNAEEPISVINAPTGIGKTKVFLDIIKKYSGDKNTERVFYFSPLLALTEDFENKIGKVIHTKNDILIYNHLFSGSLEEKEQESNIRYSNSWIFENESFNKKFVITTTQRLLMTIYSNKAGDKMKMASFRNSVLIVDEVQTIPKPILSNLKEIFKKMNQYMGTKFILVSATIPHEISEIKRIEISKNTLRDYLEQTKKQISNKPLDIQKIPIEKTLIMANTRRKAVNLYFQTKDVHPSKEIIYISTGIRKKDRSDIIKSLPSKSNYVLVSTQVVEAGVDISFSHIFREVAPLDNIIQIMGRLNREGENSDATLCIYPTDDSSIPYSPLEFKVTQEKIKDIKNSVQIYDMLEEYYSEISAKNKLNVADTEKLERCIERLDFDEVWNFVKDMVFKEDGRDTVFIPNEKEWDSVKKGLLDDTSESDFKRFGGLSASLPIPLDKIKREWWDEELIDKNILLPKKQYLQKIYDKTVGLDIWLRDDISDT